jgi:hypothetical protein
MTRFILLSVILFFGGLILNVFAADGIDIYIKACYNHGRNGSLFFSGKAEFDITETENQNDGSVVTSYNIKVFFKGNDPGIGKRLLIRQRKFDGNFSHNTLVIFVSAGESTGDISTIYSFENAHSETYVVSQTKFSFPEFMKFGRIQGDDAWMTIIGLLSSYEDSDNFNFSDDNINLFKSVLKKVSENWGTAPFQIDREEKYDHGIGSATVIVSKDEKGQLVNEYWIDVSRGYVCPVIKLYDRNSAVLQREYLASEYYQEKNSSLWYPRKYTERLFDKTTGNFVSSIEYHVKDLSLNIDIEDNIFSVNISKNSTVLDDRINTKIRKYVTLENNILPLISKEISLDSFDWLRFDSEFQNKENIVSITDEENILPENNDWRSNNSEIVIRIILFSIGLIIVLLAIFYQTFKKEK